MTEKTVQETEACDTSCNGTNINVSSVKQNLIDDPAAGDMADLFKALGDPTRVKIIHSLIQCELCVHDLTEVLGMGQSAVSHQLRFLRNLRIVKRRKEGKTVYYSIDDDHVKEIFLQTMEHLSHS
ncbi:ArsR/SmtB family transcription factor [Paenibacillus sp. B01]|uniref:ArsR/SmtB family transcription factor n=1 Tax=Paenibacillus sp. B01 TaxID=2660554 RepID=UPI00129A6D8A|nr:metalloregulator ArsR/SmtB family transcription factor [Paenibacillus sp. B01]QGG55050.1 metalloregulator ArsR/SmtB family transcription factor [Paenibacillus sp. B01]